MGRSESLKKAQKKYHQKIREQNTEVYQRIKKKQNEYLTNYVKERKKTDPEYREKMMDRNKKGAKIHYEKYKESILIRRKELRELKRDKELLDFINNNTIEISVDF